MPKLSVIMPVYNGSRFLPSALASVLGQTYSEFELIVLNDGSTEDVGSIILGCGDSRVRYYSRENRGLGETLNELVSLSRGDIVARMDADDVCVPTRFAVQLAHLESRPNVGLVGGQTSFLVGESTVGNRKYPTDHWQIRKELMQARFPLCHPAVMFRRPVFDSIGGYRLAGVGEDLDFFLRFSEATSVENVDEQVLLYRLHPNSIASTRWDDVRCAYSYALHAAKARAAGEHEISFDHYKAGEWAQRSLLTKASGKIDAYAERWFRRSITFRAQGRSGAAVCCAATSAVLRPRAACSWALGKLSLSRQ